MKKLGMVLGTILVLFIAAIVIIPLVVDVDKYRPQVVEQVNKRINGHFELGKLSLSLWGQVRIGIDGLKVSDLSGTEVLGVKQAYVHVPILSILSTSPVVTFKMSQPLINVVKNRAGQLNVMTLMKSEPSARPETPSAAPAPAPEKKPSAEMGELPPIVARAKIGIQLLDALVTYKDQVTGLSTQVKDLNLVAKDLSLSRPSEIEIWADLNTQLGKTFLLRGPARVTGTVTPTLKENRFDHAGLTAKLDMDGVEMISTDLFHKKKGVATNADLSAVASQQEVKIENLVARFANAELKMSGTVNLGTGPSPAAPRLNFKVATNEIQFKPWAELVPMLNAYDLGGAARLDADVNGTTEKPDYRGKLTVSGFTAKAPKLKAQPKIDGVVSVVTDQVDHLLMTMTAPGNDLKIEGKVVSFTKPQADFQVTSNGMDLDQLVEFPPRGQQVKAAPTAGAPKTPGETASGKPVAKEDYDAMLAPLRSNKIMADLIAHVGVRMRMIKAYDVKVSDILCTLDVKDLTAGLNSCGLKVFSGAIHANGLMNLKPQMPTYKFDTQVTGLNLSEAVESQMALFKNTVKGIADFKMVLNGASFNPDPAISNLKATGNLKVGQAVFATIDVIKAVSEALNKSLAQLGEKIPALKGKSVGNMPNRTSEYESVMSDFTIGNGKFSAPNFSAKAVPQKGIDVKGDTAVGMKDYSLNATWEVVDTYDLTRLKGLSVEYNGVQVPHVLSEGNSPVRFPMHIGCTLMAPCYSYTEVPQFLMTIALKNAGGAVSGRAKEELRKKAESAIQQYAPPQVQEQLKNKLKGLFR